MDVPAMNDARILLADDDEELCALLRDFLVREGFEVDLAHDGDEALRRAHSGGYDAVILDVMLPQRSGLELLRELRRSSKLPVLMLTALGEDIDRILGLELGADDYVPKPCNPREIAARLRAILRRTQGDNEGPRLTDLTIGPVALRAASRNVTVRGEPILADRHRIQHPRRAHARGRPRGQQGNALARRAEPPARPVRPKYRCTHFQIAA